jgi:hypothetical protein
VLVQHHRLGGSTEAEMSGNDNMVVIRFGYPSLFRLPLRINHTTIIAEIREVAAQPRRLCPDP